MYSIVGGMIVSYIDKSGLLCSPRCDAPNGCNSRVTSNCNSSNDNSTSFLALRDAVTAEMSKCFSKKDAAVLGVAFACLARNESNFDGCCHSQGPNGGVYGLFQLDDDRWKACGETGSCKKICDENDWSCQIAAARRILVSACNNKAKDKKNQPITNNVCGAMAQYWIPTRGEGNGTFFKCLEDHKLSQSSLEAIACPDPFPKGCTGCWGNLQLKPFPCNGNKALKK